MAKIGGNKMKKKLHNILDIAGFLVIIYGLALGFIFLLSIINFNDKIMIFIILPLPIVIAIYEYFYHKEATRDYTQSLTLLNKELGVQFEEISFHEKRDTENIIIIDSLRDEIMELNKHLWVTKDGKKYYINDLGVDSHKFELQLQQNDINFEYENLPYIGMTVKVEYNKHEVIGKITRILDEKIVKYRVAKCGSKKYTESQLERVK